jgi:prevent-host-death family protein
VATLWLQKEGVALAKEIGVRELKNQASQIVRAVREEMAEYIITVHGEPVAVLRPLTDEETQRLDRVKVEAVLAEMEALAEKVTAAWQSERSAVELIEEQRRG